MKSPSRQVGLLVPLLLILTTGCGSGRREEPEIVWGRRGVQPGDLFRPRAIAIDAEDNVCLVDFTARIQVFDRDGNFLDHCWTTPDYRNGRPSGLSIDRDGNLLVSDSHYNCVRVRGLDGTELRVLGEGLDLGYVSDAVQDEGGYYYLAEFGDKNRISKIDRDGKLVRQWGGTGSGKGEFARPRALAFGPDQLLYVVDACNHRIQVFTRDGDYVRSFGEAGSGEGQLSYPYDLAFAPTGELYVVEYDNHRVQKFTKEGRPLGCWGGPGRAPGRLHNPWALAVDSRGRVHVIDTENHRVQRIRF
jgi:DNA-binding beta-propeller fold protein YncE